MIKTPKKCFKGVIALMCCVTMLLGLCKAPVVSMAAEVDYYTPSNGQVLMFENAESGWALNTMHGSSSAPNGTAMDLYRYDGTDTERFRVSSNSDGSFMLSPLCTPSKYIDVRRYGAPLAVGQGICIWAADGDPLKNFKIKVVGDKVAIVLATRPDLCIAPSSAANASTQNQLIVRQLDTSKTEMLWTLKDGNWNTISAAAGNIENYIDPNPNYKFVTLSPMCMTNKALQVENGKIKYGTPANSLAESYKQGQVFRLIQGRNNSFYLCPVTRDSNIFASFVTASSLSDHAELITAGFNASNVDCQKIVSIENETYGYCPMTIGGVGNGDVCSFKFNNWYAIDVRDFGNSPERVVQVYPYSDNSAQQFRVNVVDDVRTVFDSIARDRMDSLLSDLGVNGNNTVYFTVNQRPCNENTRLSNHGCSNCSTGNIVNAGWFRNIFGNVSVGNFPSHDVDAYSRAYSGQSCFGFACFAQWKIYARNNSDNLVGERVATIRFNASDVKANVRPGDVLRMNGHSVLIYKVTDTGIVVLDSNWSINGQLNCVVQKHTISYDHFQFANATVYVNRVTTAW